MSAVCFCASSLLSASDVGSSSTLIGYRGLASRVGALKVQFSELRALVRWARYCVYVRNYVQLPRLMVRPHQPRYSRWTTRVCRSMQVNGAFPLRHNYQTKHPSHSLSEHYESKMHISR